MIRLLDGENGVNQGGRVYRVDKFRWYCDKCGAEFLTRYLSEAQAKHVNCPRSSAALSR